MGESASPFIDEGKDFTSERERVCMLLNLVAHADGYRMMVGTHNTVGCTWEVTSSCSGMADVGTCYIVDAQRHVRFLSCSLATVNVGAHNTIDASEARGEPYRICLVWELMVPTTL